VPGVEAKILDPRATWADANSYDAQARKLAGMFVANFAKFEDHVSPDVRAASPMLPLAAE
jgi:phosphoenolpyruvate carboxykinase (ATP)